MHLIKVRNLFLVFILTPLIILLTCSKSQEKRNSIEEVDKKTGYYTVDVDKVFTDNEESLPNEEEIKEKINSYFVKKWEKPDLSGGLLVAVKNRVLFEKYIGYKNWNTKEALTDTTSIHVASVSKIMTALAILKLVEKGFLELDQKVITLFPEFPYPEITVRHLLTHRSGLKKYEYFTDQKEIWDHSIPLTNQALLSLYIDKKPPLEFVPGDKFNYCNVNFAFLANIVEEITHQEFPEAMEEMLFKPLGMDHTYVFQEKNKEDYYSYVRNRLYEFTYLDLIYGDKNVYTTPKDLYRLSLAMYSKNFLRKDLLEEMFSPHQKGMDQKGMDRKKSYRNFERDYGLGMHLVLFNNNKKLIYHNGWWHGNNAVFVHLLDEKVSIIAVGNKYSKNIYEAVKLVSLFGNYYLENVEF